MALSREKQLARYRQRLEASAKWRKQEGLDDLWHRLVDLYRNKHFKGSTTEDRIAVGIAFGTINVIFPSVSVNHPKVVVNARDPEDYDKALILEAVVNYWWRHYRVKTQFRRAVKDFLVVGHGWVKTGYRFVEEDVPLDDDERDNEFQSAVEEADTFAEANPDLAGDLPTDDEIAASLPETKANVVEDRPFAERVSPFDIYVDPEATSMEDLTWIAQKVVRPLEDVRDDDRYSKAVRRRVEPDSMMNKEYWSERDEKKWGDDIKRVTVWEYYDVKQGTMSIFTERGDAFLKDPTKMPYQFGHPFVQLRNYDVPDVFYPIGDLEAIEPLNLELDKTRSQMMNARKRYARKHIFRPEAFDAEGRAALEDPTDGRMIPLVEGYSEAMADAIAPLPQEPMSADTYNLSTIIEGDIDAVSGVSEYQRGSTPEIRRTATEASMIQDATNARAADKLAIIEGSIGQVAENLVQLAQQFMTEEGTARVMGKNGYPLWVPYEPEDIQGEYDFEVEGGSTQPNNEGFRRQQALDLLNAMGPFMELQVVNPQELARHVLREGFGIKNPEKFLGQSQDPMAQLGDPSMLPPEEGGLPPEEEELPPEEEPPPPLGQGGVPPAVLAQLQGQVNFDPQHLGV